jgi:enediyne biosynthesis protein E4
MDGSSGYLSHSVMPLYFGLGTATTVDRIEVRWPSGQRQVVAGPVTTGAITVVTEPRPGDSRP